MNSIVQIISVAFQSENTVFQVIFRGRKIDKKGKTASQLRHELYTKIGVSFEM